jgi:hypothetical protein
MSLDSFIWTNCTLGRTHFNDDLVLQVKPVRDKGW